MEQGREDIQAQVDRRHSLPSQKIADNQTSARLRGEQERLLTNLYHNHVNRMRKKASTAKKTQDGGEDEGGDESEGEESERKEEGIPLRK